MPPRKRPAKRATERTSEPTRMTSIRLSPAIIETLKRRGESLGVPWQTVLKMILTRYADGEL
jgi:predicted DNA binding CopG/RHH family protein